MTVWGSVWFEMTESVISITVWLSINFGKVINVLSRAFKRKSIWRSEIISGGRKRTVPAVAREVLTPFWAIVF